MPVLDQPHSRRRTRRSARTVTRQGPRIAGAAAGCPQPRSPVPIARRRPTAVMHPGRCPAGCRRATLGRATVGCSRTDPTISGVTATVETRPSADLVTEPETEPPAPQGPVPEALRRWQDPAPRVGWLVTGLTTIVAAFTRL